MPEETKSPAKVVLPRSKRFYVGLSVCYALFAIDEIWNLMRTTTHTSHLMGSWQTWIVTVTFVYCMWFFFEIWRAVTNMLEKIICICSMIYFASLIPARIQSLGYSWFRLPHGRLITVILMSVSALFVFVRTLQVFKQREPATAT